MIKTTCRSIRLVSGQDPHATKLSKVDQRVQQARQHAGTRALSAPLSRSGVARKSAYADVHCGTPAMHVNAFRTAKGHRKSLGNTWGSSRSIRCLAGFVRWTLFLPG